MYKDQEQQRQAQHANYLKHRHKYRERTRARRAANKTWFKNNVLPGLKCMQCGETHSACLDFHHRNPHQRDMNISKMVNSLRNHEWILTEIAKCIVLCSNCHRKLHARMREVSAGD